MYHLIWLLDSIVLPLYLRLTHINMILKPTCVLTLYYINAIWQMYYVDFIHFNCEYLLWANTDRYNSRTISDHFPRLVGCIFLPLQLEFGCKWNCQNAGKQGEWKPAQGLGWQLGVKKLRAEAASVFQPVGQCSASIKVHNCGLGQHADQTDEMVRI